MQVIVFLNALYIMILIINYKNQPFYFNENIMMKKLSLFALGLCSAMSVQAHMLWLERGTDQKTKAYFGEYSENAIESQQGPLKGFNTAKATQDQKEIAATVNDQYLIYATKGTADVRVSNDLIHGDMLAQFRAKAGRYSTQAVSELELVPVIANSNTFTVIFQGKPLAKQEVIIFAPNRWSKTYYSNEQGQITVETPWSGQYVIEAGRSIEQAGEYNKKTYKNRYVVATLSFEVK